MTNEQKAQRLEEMAANREADSRKLHDLAEKLTPGAAQFRVTPPGKVWDTATALLALPALIAELRELRALTTPEA